MDDRTMTPIVIYIENDTYYLLKRRTLPDGSALANLEKAPRAGLEPATHRLTADCSAIELPRNAKGL